VKVPTNPSEAARGAENAAEGRVCQVTTCQEPVSDGRTRCSKHLEQRRQTLANRKEWMR
jgi:hypothetical protein